MKKRVYLDYASAMPMDKDVFLKMRPYMLDVYGNPGANHTEGREAKEVLEEARRSVADALKVKPEEIIFASGATEANTLAIIGHIEGLKKKGRTYKDMHVITSAIEHVNVLKSIEALKEKGVHVSVVFPNEAGIITPESIEKELQDKTVLVSVQYVNSEIGTVMPLRKIKKVVAKYNESIAVHADAAQAALFHSVLMERVGVDMLVLDGQKFGGPRGSGVLIKKKNVELFPIVFGGKQEWGYRPGTENVFLAVGFAEALKKAQKLYEKRAEEIALLRNWTINEIEKNISNVFLNGDKEERSPNNINMSFVGRDSEYLAALLDKEGFAVSTKITCDSGAGKGSDVVRVLTQDEGRALSTLRITLGPDTKKKDMEAFVAALIKCVAFLDEEGKAFL
ncbi:MAG: cysteine desulfurase family protein [Patescibacteria group bacterium UBA2103]